MLLKQDSTQSESWRLCWVCWCFVIHYFLLSPPVLLERIEMTSSRVGISTAAMAVWCTKSVWVCLCRACVFYCNTRCSALFFILPTGRHNVLGLVFVCCWDKPTQLKFSVAEKSFKNICLIFYSFCEMKCFMRWVLERFQGVVLTTVKINASSDCRLGKCISYYISTRTSAVAWKRHLEPPPSPHTSHFGLELGCIGNGSDNQSARVIEKHFATILQHLVHRYREITGILCVFVVAVSWIKIVANRHV
jgi:hypothetical protein